MADLGEHLVDRVAGLLKVEFGPPALGLRFVALPHDLSALPGDKRRADRQADHDHDEQQNGECDQWSMAPRPFRHMFHQCRPLGFDRLVLQESPQVGGQFNRAGVSTARLLRGGLQDDGLQVRSYRVIDPSGWAWIVLGDAAKQRLSIGSVERRTQRQQFIQRHAERVNVGALIDTKRLAQCLLGTHIAEGSQQVTGHRQIRAALQSGQPEIRHPQPAAMVQQQVGRLDVAVNDAQLVGVLQRFGSLNAQFSD